MPAALAENFAWTPEASAQLQILIVQLSKPGAAPMKKSVAIRYALALAVGADTALVLGVTGWADRVRAARAASGLSQGGLAEELGYSSRGTIGNVESGRWPPPPRVVDWVETMEAQHAGPAPEPTPARSARPRSSRLRFAESPEQPLLPMTTGS
jgi:DNA-binding XRE family transcriptional regulator